MDHTWVGLRVHRLPRIFPLILSQLENHKKGASNERRISRSFPILPLAPDLKLKRKARRGDISLWITQLFKVGWEIQCENLQFDGGLLRSKKRGNKILSITTSNVGL